MPVDRSKRRSILVADDEEVIRELLRRRLSVDGYEVETAEDGEEAVARIGRDFVNVVVTDMKMPGLDGIEVLKRAKAASPDTEVIVMTGYAATETAIEAVRLGAYDYLQKPFEHIDDVVHKVKLALRQQRLQMQNRDLERRLATMAEVPARASDALDAIVRQLEALRSGGGAAGEEAREIARLVGVLREQVARLGDRTAS